jgi:putrescine transport system ATP-binding protein
MLRLTRMTQFARRNPPQVSGGQRQRGALARSLARAPKLLLLDEPLGALDKKLREETQFELMDIQEKTGTPFDFVTHHQEEAMTVAIRVAVMDHGKIIQVATPPKIYEEPNSVYVADFIGDVNIIEGAAHKTSEDGYDIHWAEGQEPIHAKTTTVLSEGQKAFVALRPEKISIAEEKPEGAVNAVKGKIIDIGYLGNISTYHVELPGGVMVKAQATNTRRLSRRNFTWEDEVWLSWTLTAASVLER